MSSDSQANYSAVLADLKAKREKLDAAIAAIEELVSNGVGVSALSVTPGQKEEVRADSFPKRELGRYCLDSGLTL